MPKRPIRAEDLLRIVFLGDPQISPDGNRVLFTHKTINEKNKYITNLFSVDLEGKARQWTQGEGGNGAGRWSPDGTQIAFVSGRDKPSSQIYVIPVDGGEGRKLTSLPEGKLVDIRWSPDSTKIAFTFREQMAGWTDKEKKEREEKGGSTPPIEIDDIWYRLDGDGYFAGQRHKIYIVDVGSGEHWKLYEGSVYGDYSFDWAPNSQELVVSHTANRRPFSEPPNDQIYRVDLSGQAWQLEGLPKGNKDGVKWSPDGKWIAYAGTIDEHDPWGTRNTRVYAVRADGGEPHDLTGSTDYDASVATLSDSKEANYGATLLWNGTSDGLWLEVGWHGESQIAYAPLDGSGIQLRTEGHQHVNLGSVSKDGVLAAIVGTATRLAEVAIVEPELASGRLAPRVLTGFNQAFHDEIKIMEPEEHWLDSTDGTKVHTWVIKPVGYLEPKRYPAVLEIHGGPHTQYGWAFFHEFQLLAAEGYVVVYSNPRGSKGYGEEHTRAIHGNWGVKDWEDIQAVTRWMQHQPYIHPGQMGVMGGSYGGYMTNWVIGHSHDYKAAITDRCVSNMGSMAGSSDFPVNKDQYFKGFAWGDLEDIRELWRQSPIAYFKDVKTPTLVIHSEGDLRCNIEQGEQVFAALQLQGVESRFVRYPKESSHGLSRNGPPDLRLHRLSEITRWWEKHLK